MLGRGPVISGTSGMSEADHPLRMLSPGGRVHLRLVELPDRDPTVAVA